jgi:hypothetical protein
MQKVFLLSFCSLISSTERQVTKKFFLNFFVVWLSVELIINEKKLSAKTFCIAFPIWRCCNFFTFPILFLPSTPTKPHLISDLWDLTRKTRLFRFRAQIFFFMILIKSPLLAQTFKVCVDTGSSNYWLIGTSCNSGGCNGAGVWTHKKFHYSWAFTKH